MKPDLPKMKHRPTFFRLLCLINCLAWLSVIVFPSAHAELRANLLPAAHRQDQNSKPGEFDLRLTASLIGHRHQIAVVDFSADGQFLATWSYREKTTKLWNTAAGRLIAEVDGTIDFRTWPPIEPERPGVFSPDSHLLVTLRGTTAKVWDAATGQLKYSLTGHQADIDSAVFSPNGERLATSSADGTVRLWSSTTGQLITMLAVWRVKKIPRWRVVSQFLDIPISIYVSFSSDGRRLLTAVEWESSPAKLWDVETGRLLATLDGPTERWGGGKGPAAVKAMFSPDGKLILTESYSEAWLWNASTGGLKDSFLSRGAWARFSPDGKFLAIGSSGETVGILDVESMDVRIPLAKTAFFASRNVFSPDGRTLIVNNTLMELPSGRVIARLPLVYRDGGWIQGLLDFDIVSFQPNSKILMGAHHKAVRFWDSATGQLVIEKPEARDPALFSPNGKWLVTTAADKTTALLWEVVTP
ncbi:MAG: hypothetical protein AUI36_01875 [Cyanobacteria bacterium 13_1_40CM_2_61_4]|nr:MAG: hypothetical protein AUI36_01875 [Cyanobacteria bacterium 13_1_40CM_2_61_4]